MTENISFTIESNEEHSSIETNNEEDSSVVILQRKRVFHNDKQYTNRLTELDITMESNIPLNTNCLYFSYKLASKKFEIVKSLKHIRHFLTNRKYLYEIVNSNGLIRFYIDLDPPDKLNPVAYSYDDITNLCDNFIKHINNEYNYTNPITYSIQISITDEDLQNNEYKTTDKFIFSSHIIFNIMTESVEQIKQVMILFKSRNYPLHDYIDLHVYSNRKKFRTINQQKEQIYVDTPVNNRKLQKFVKKQYDDKLYHDVNIYETDFVSVIVPDDETDICVLDSGKNILLKNTELFIDIIIENTIIELIVKGYTIKYNINQDTKLEKFINKIVQTDLTNRYYWTNILNLIITVIIMNGISWDDLLDNQHLKRFLTISKIGKYLSSNYVESNILLIKDKIIKKELHQHYQSDFIEPLKKQEIEFIYTKLNINPTELITISSVVIQNKDVIQIIQTIENEDEIYFKTSFYNQTTRILIVFPSKSEPNSNIKQYQLELELIKTNTEYSNRTDIEKCNYKIIDINTLSEYKCNPRLNTYQGAPVGAGKSYYCLTRDIVSIMNDNPNNKILQITDGIVISEKTYKDTNDTINTAKTDNKLNRHKVNISIYNKLKKYTDYAEIDIFVCCLDSIEKHRGFNPTHVIIDEYTNVNKRISSTKKIGNDKDKLREYYFMLCSTRILKLYDADIDDNYLSILKQILNVEMTIYKLNGFVQLNNNIILNNYDSTLEMIFEQIANRKKISISSSGTPEFMEKLADMIYAKYPVSGFLITSNGASLFGKIEVRSKKLKKQLSSETTGWKSYDVAMWSPAVMTGVSFNDKIYYDYHFHIIELLSADAISNVQMMYRVRQNNNKTIYVAVKNDNLTTLKHISIENMLNRRISNFNTLTTNVATGSNVKQLSIKQDSRNQNKFVFKIDPKISILANIQNIEEIQKNIQQRKFLFSFFQTVNRYGSNNINCEFYNNEYMNEIISLEPEVINVITDNVDKIVLLFEPVEPVKPVEPLCRTEPINEELLMINRVKNAFDKSVMLEKISDKHQAIDDDPLEYSKKKTFFYLRYNIPFYSWNYYNIINKCIELLNNPIALFHKIEELINPYKGFNFPEANSILEFCEKYSGDNRIKYNYTGDSTQSIYNINTDTLLKYSDNDVVLKALEQTEDINKLLLFLYNPIITNIVQTTELVNQPMNEPMNEPINVETAVLQQKDKIDYQHPIDNGSGLYDNELYQGDAGIYKHISHFYKITDIAYFQVKDIIYEIFNNLLKAHTNIKLTDMLRIGTNKDDYLYFIEFIYGLYISFKIFDLLSIDFNDLSIIYLNEDYKQPDPLNPVKYINGILFEKELYQNQFNKLISETTPFLEFILTEKQIDTYKKDCQNRQALNYAFKRLNLTIELGEVRNKIGIIKLDTKYCYKYRTQQINLPIRYFHEEDTKTIKTALKKHNITFSDDADLSTITNNNILDEVLFYLQNQTTGINPVSYPKIKLYNPYSNSDQCENFVAKNKDANTDYLRYGINLCCANTKTILEKLNTLDTSLQTTVYFNPLRKSNKVDNIAESMKQLKNEKNDKLTIYQENKRIIAEQKEAEKIKKEAEKEAEKIKKETEKEAEKLKKEADKEAKKQENALKQKEKDASSKVCKNCGRDYILKNPKRHYEAFPDCKDKMK